jgi:hypothetical protein
MCSLQSTNPSLNWNSENCRSKGLQEGYVEDNIWGTIVISAKYVPYHCPPDSESQQFRDNALVSHIPQFQEDS